MDNKLAFDPMTDAKHVSRFQRDHPKPAVPTFPTG